MRGPFSAMILQFTFLLVGMLSMASSNPVDSVSLTLQTRGVHKLIRITARQTQTDVNGVVNHYATPISQWQVILKALDKVDLSGLSSLPVDVSKSSVDAALSAHVQISSGGRTYESVHYDHPHPPTKLVSLVRAIVGSLPPDSQPDFK